MELRSWKWRLWQQRDRDVLWTSRIFGKPDGLPQYFRDEHIERLCGRQWAPRYSGHKHAKLGELDSASPFQPQDAHLDAHCNGGISGVYSRCAFYEHTKTQLPLCLPPTHRTDSY